MGQPGGGAGGHSQAAGTGSTAVCRQRTRCGVGVGLRREWAECLCGPGSIALALVGPPAWELGCPSSGCLPRTGRATLGVSRAWRGGVQGCSHLRLARVVGGGGNSRCGGWEGQMRGHARLLRMLPWPPDVVSPGSLPGHTWLWLSPSGWEPSAERVLMGTGAQGSRILQGDQGGVDGSLWKRSQWPFPRTAGLGPHGFSLQSSVGSCPRHPWP